MNQILPFRPTLPMFDSDHLAVPLSVLVSQTRHRGGWVTAVTRIFEPEANYCGRCPLSMCSIHHGVCLVTVQKFVTIEDAANLTTHDLRYVDSLTGNVVHDPSAEGIDR